MATVYSIALRLPERTQEEIKNWYKETYHRDVSVRLLHCSVLFSFIKEDYTVEEVIEVVQQITFMPFLVTLGALTVYTATEQAVIALTFTTESQALMNGFHENFEVHVKRNFGDEIGYDTSVFADGTLPEYEPHVSLEYGVDPERAEKLKEKREEAAISFMVAPELFIVLENRSGIMREYEVPRVAMPEFGER